MSEERRLHLSDANTDIFAKRFKQAIKDAGLTRDEIASDGACGKEALSCYCSGKRIPNGRSLLYICNYLNVSSDWLLGLSDVKRAVW